MLQRERREPLIFIGRIFSSQKKKLVAIILCGLFGGLFEGSSIGVLGLAVASLADAGINSDSLIFTKLLNVMRNWLPVNSSGGFFLVLLGLAAMLQLARSAIQFVGALVLIRFQSKATIRLFSILTQQIMTLSYLEIVSRPSGHIALLIQEARSTLSVLTQITTFLTNVFFLLSYLALLLFSMPSLGLFSILLLLVFFFVLTKVVRKIASLAKKRLGVARQISELIFEYLNSPRFLRVFDVTESSKEILDKYRAQEVRYTERSMIISSAIRPVLDLVAIGSVVGVLAVIFFVSNEQPAEMIGSVSIFVLAMFRMIPRFFEINSLRLTIARVLPGIGLLAEFLRKEKRAFIVRSGSKWEGLHSEIVLQQVTFSYGSKEGPVLQDVSLRIPVRQTIGIIGPSGSGKSTLMDVLLRLIPVQSGRILIDGEDLAGIRISDWLAKIGHVEQDASLFNMTFADNIRLGKADATDSEIVEAAKEADIHEFISGLSDGYETLVGNRGHRLSGGQKQRVAVARALIRRAEILIFDEATSALDSESEKRIRETIDRLRHDYTIIVIAHRLSTLRNVDQIVVLEHGRVSETGTPEELLKKESYFQQAWAAQVSLQIAE
jgi:ABC-type multidrug transport system fused ATPase/permease subunit